MKQTLAVSFDTAVEQLTTCTAKRRKCKNDVEYLATKMAAGCRDEGIERKKVHDGLEARMVEGFRNEEKGRKRAHEELKEE